MRYSRAEYLGHYIFFLLLRFAGRAPAYLLLALVIFFYVLFFPGSRKIQPYLRCRFPGSGPVKRLWYAYRLYYCFGQVAIDSVWQSLGPENTIAGEFADRQRLLDLIGEGRGVILLTAHIGNWQTALFNLKDLPAAVYALMDLDQQALIERFKGLGPGFKIIQPGQEGFGGIIEAMSALARGEVVTVMGDRADRGPRTYAEFLGARIGLPSLPYVLARSSGAPVVLLFSHRISRSRYQVRIWDVLRADQSASREECCRQMAQAFARALEEYVEQHPFQWFNFPGLERPIMAKAGQTG